MADARLTVTTILVTGTETIMLATSGPSQVRLGDLLLAEGTDEILFGTVERITLCGPGQYDLVVTWKESWGPSHCLLEYRDAVHVLRPRRNAGSREATAPIGVSQRPSPDPGKVR